MSTQKIRYDLPLVKKLFKANLNSLVIVSADSLQAQQEQYRELLESIKGEEGKVDDWLGKSAHYANIDWIFLNSILLSAYSFFEHHLLKLSRIVEKEFQPKIQIEHIDGNGVVKFCSYLFLVGDIQSADRSLKEWQEINYFQKIRNLIAHNGGMMLNDPMKELKRHECYQFLSKHKVIMAGNLGHIRITDLNFIKRFCELVIILSEKLIVEIEEKLKNQY